MLQFLIECLLYITPIKRHKSWVNNNYPENLSQILLATCHQAGVNLE